VISRRGKRREVRAASSVGRTDWNDGELNVEIADDGVGGRPRRRDQAFGVADRLAVLDGRLEIRARQADAFSPDPRSPMPNPA
jgi:glucose-6-phosphate-specific signal transduction histidine kinase